MFWCAGCQGSMYPMNGNVSASIGHVQASRLALSRFAYKLHRELVAWGTMGSKGLCGKYLMPVMRKQQYRFQATNPNPATKGRYACAPDWRLHHLHVGRTGHPRDRRGHGLPGLAQAELLRAMKILPGVVVLRGLPGGSAKTLTAALAKIADDGGKLDAVGIDPRLFRAFGIEAVPTYVVTSSDFDLCDGFDCRTQVPPHDRMSGNVSVSYALETFAQGGGPGALLASQHLSRLRRSTQ
jgi:type-F conjugative transfer system pilin assembly protein TrbC